MGQSNKYNHRLGFDEKVKPQASWPRNIYPMPPPGIGYDSFILLLVSFEIGLRSLLYYYDAVILQSSWTSVSINVTTTTQETTLIEG